MSLNRYAAKRDLAEPLIVQTLERAGFHVERLSKPVDLAVRKAWYPKGINALLEVKTPDAKGRIKIRKDRAEQNAFIDRGGALRVGTPEAALEALRMFELLISP